MKAAHINPFLNSTINLFENMLGVSPDVGQKSLLTNFQSHRWEISGVIGITGAAEGVVAIRLPRLLAEHLLEKSGVVCYDRAEFEQTINEMVGEMVNVIAGNSLDAVSRFSLDISVPFVVQGQNHSIAWPRKSPIIVIPFATPHGPFEVNVSLKENSQTLYGTA